MATGAIVALVGLVVYTTGEVYLPYTDPYARSSAPQVLVSPTGAALVYRF